MKTGSRVRAGLACVLVAAALVLSGAGMRTADAQAKDSEFSFAVIDVQRVIRDSKATRSIRPQIEKLKEGYESGFKKQEEELRGANQDLAGQRAILSPEAYADRRREFQQRATGVQREVQETKRLLDRALGSAMSKVHNSLRQITAEIAKEQSLTAIFPRTAVILVERKYDITSEVLKRLDQQLPSVAVTITNNPPSADENKR
ncbi:MAG: OmpH family outer membrane protein [Alphaproteobacteria bacterium]|nr:OmpH family outer membrane protein [Alphaproteobacteria bacterium]